MYISAVGLDRGRECSFGCGQRGAALAEAAIVVPILALIVFGIIQWGLLISAQLALRSASAAAARYAILDGATDEQIRDSARLAISPTLDPNGLPDQNIVINQIALPSGATAKEVQLSYDYTLLIAYLFPGSGGVFQLNSSSTMR